MRVTLVRGRFRDVDVSSPSSSVVSDLVRGGVLGALDSEVVSSPSDGSVSDGSAPSGGRPNSVVSGGLVLVIVDVVEDVVREVVDAYVGSTKSRGACCGLSAPLVSATTPHTASAMTASAATLAPRTAGVE
ncbi:hypothetical protein [Mycolicibacterium goodii]|uniref:hypothetical protein n=1 Tax=Mycolicibacterium goodii TaxID=134601 RepID=UPI00143D9B9D|nr:hypothetical protein [Mycolicibacterium goodii]